MEKIVIVGGGGHAKVLISIIKKLGNFRIIGYTDLKDHGSILGIKFLGSDEELSTIISTNSNISASIGIGYIKINKNRKQIFDKLKYLGYNLPSIVSPNSVVNEEVEIGEGTIIFDGAVINSGTKIGKGVIINSNSTIEHDCIIGNFVHIAPGAIINGGVQIGDFSFIGSGATVIQYLKINNDCLVGAGSVVIKDCIKKGKYLGAPAKLIA